MAELADAPDLGSGGRPRAGSSPVICIITEPAVDTIIDCRFVTFMPKTADVIWFQSY